MMVLVYLRLIGLVRLLSGIVRVIQVTTEFNPVKAKGLLRAYGKPVKFKMVTMPIKNFIIEAKLHQTFWKRMGVQVELKVVPPGPAYFRAIRSGRFDAWLVGISEAVDPGLQGQAFFLKIRVTVPSQIFQKLTPH